MKEIAIKTINILERNKESITIVQIESDIQKLMNICNKVPIISMIFTFNSYYRFGHELMDEGYFPFIIRDGKYEWNVPYEQVTLQEFLDTHNLDISNGITLEMGYCAAGGIGSLLEAGWTIAITYLEHLNINNIDYLESVPLVILALHSLKDKFINKKVNPLEVVEATYLRYVWNAYEIADMLDINVKQAKSLLIGLGYTFDIHRKMYVLYEGDYENSLKIYDLLKKNEENILMQL